MSNDQNGNGAMPPMPPDFSSPEEMMRFALEQAVRETMSFVKSVVPHAKDDVIQRAAEQAIGEQDKIVETILGDVVNEATHELHPRWGYSIVTSLGQAGTVLVEKSTRALPGDLHSISQYVGALALASSPGARAVLYTLGLKINWHQAKARSSLIVAQ